MFKFLKSLGVAVLLSVLPLQANAAVVTSTVTGGFDSAGEVSTSMNVSAGAELSVFVNGTYSVANKVWLQRERGSPGSGAWQNVVQVSGTGSGLAANGTGTFRWTNGPNRDGYRLFMSAAGTGDVMAQLTDGSLTPQAFAEGRTYIREFEDFFANTALETGIWNTDQDAGGTNCALSNADDEGSFTCISHTAGSLNDTVCLSHTDITDAGSLISNGWTAVEVRLQYNDASGVQVTIGVVDTECAATGLEPFDMDSNVGTLSTYTDAAGWILQDDADDTDAWQPWSFNTSVEGNDGGAIGTGFEFEAFTSAGIATYETLRLEIDSAGDCYWYASTTGVPQLVYAEDTCVASAALVGPWVSVNTSDAANDATTIDIDYIEFITTRPAS